MIEFYIGKITVLSIALVFTKLGGFLQLAIHQLHEMVSFDIKRDHDGFGALTGFGRIFWKAGELNSIPMMLFIELLTPKDMASRLSPEQEIDGRYSLM